MKYLIGIDGGGTGCRVAVSDISGRMLATAKGGPANIASDLATAKINILDTIEKAFTHGGLERDLIPGSGVVMGLAGSNLGDFSEKFGQDFPLKNHLIVNDSHITLAGALGTANGCIAAIGTGSVFATRTSKGIHMLGGWGFLLGDDGSGAALGHDLLRITILAADGVIAHSKLTRAALQQFNGQIEHIVESARGFSPGDFARLAPLVIDALQHNDAHANALFDRHTSAVRASIDACGFDENRPFCMLGGLGPTYLEALPAKYRKAAIPPKGDALSGAINMAKSHFSALVQGSQNA